LPKNSPQAPPPKQGEDLSKVSSSVVDLISQSVVSKVKDSTNLAENEQIEIDEKKNEVITHMKSNSLIDLIYDMVKNSKRLESFDCQLNKFLKSSTFPKMLIENKQKTIKNERVQIVDKTIIHGRSYNLIDLVYDTVTNHKRFKTSDSHLCKFLKLSIFLKSLIGNKYIPKELNKYGKISKDVFKSFSESTPSGGDDLKDIERKPLKLSISLVVYKSLADASKTYLCSNGLSFQNMFIKILLSSLFEFQTTFPQVAGVEKKLVTENLQNEPG